MEDIVEKLRSLEKDHAPDGWPAVQMRDITALLDEIDLLRAQMVPTWDDDTGEPMTLAAAAKDADEWLKFVEWMHAGGAGPWKFSDPESLKKLQGCRKMLARMLNLRSN